MAIQQVKVSKSVAPKSASRQIRSRLPGCRARPPQDTRPDRRRGRTIEEGRRILNSNAGLQAQSKDLVPRGWINRPSCPKAALPRELYLSRIAYLVCAVGRARVMCRSWLIIAFVLSAASECEAETGLASYYGGRGHAGEMTCAHRTRPFGSIVTVSYAGHSIRCRVMIAGRSFGAVSSTCR